MTFPTTPYIGQKWLDGGRVWQWNGTAWQAANNSVFWEEIAGKPTYMSGSTIVSTSAPANPIPGLQWWNPTADRLFIWDGAAWVEPNTSTTYPWDADAVDYIYRVEAADGQELEQATRKAINAFVTGCKTDAIWTALKASCIMAGARTLAGALTPLVGAAPTNVNFVSADYLRKTGLKGASAKRLNPNRLNNADPQDSKHIAVYKTEPETSATDTVVLGTRFATSGSHSHLYTQATSGRQYFAANSVDGGFRTDAGFSTVAVGLIGASRNSSANFVRRLQGVSTNTANNSTAPNSEQLMVFAANTNAFYSTSRVSFYSIGEHLDLALLDARVSTLMSDLQTSIP